MFIEERNDSELVLITITTYIQIIQLTLCSLFRLPKENVHYLIPSVQLKKKIIKLLKFCPCSWHILIKYVLF